MKNVKIVIGALWGDEAKGHMTHILTNDETNDSSIVVRFNGGSQASHTVISGTKSHAFRHIGSGTFKNAATYLSSDFICNIFQFIFEIEKIEKITGYTPVVYVSPSSLVTTSYDEIINQEIEIMRGKNRHGSCGLGINETVERSKLNNYCITVSDLFFEDTLKEKLEKIRDEYVPFRLKNEYGLDWVSRDLIEKPVEGRRGPATVSGSDFAIVHWGNPWEGAEK